MLSYICVLCVCVSVKLTWLTIEASLSITFICKHSQDFSQICGSIQVDEIR